MLRPQNLFHQFCHHIWHFLHAFTYHSHGICHGAECLLLHPFDLLQLWTSNFVATHKWLGKWAPVCTNDKNEKQQPKIEKFNFVWNNNNICFQKSKTSDDFDHAVLANEGWAFKCRLFIMWFKWETTHFVLNAAWSQKCDLWLQLPVIIATSIVNLFQNNPTERQQKRTVEFVWSCEGFCGSRLARWSDQRGNSSPTVASQDRGIVEVTFCLFWSVSFHLLW